MKEEDSERQFERNDARRCSAEARAWDKLGKQLVAADALIGEFAGGEFYVNVRSKTGRMTGGIRRFSRRTDASMYLIRNHYV